MMDGGTSKEGVDFKWVPMRDSKGAIVKDGKGNAVKTRHFFTREEKLAMKEPKSATKKAKAETKKEVPTAKTVQTPEITTRKLSPAGTKGRGDGVMEMVTRSLDKESPSYQSKKPINARGPIKAPPAGLNFNDWKNFMTRQGYKFKPGEALSMHSAYRSRGMAKGGLVGKSRTGHVDHRKKGMFK